MIAQLVKTFTGQIHQVRATSQIHDNRASRQTMYFINKKKSAEQRDSAAAG